MNGIFIYFQISIVTIHLGTKCMKIMLEKPENMLRVPGFSSLSGDMWAKNI